MGSSKAPSPITPGQAAQAAMGTAAAGEMMSVANQPIDQYSNLINTMALGPASMRTQQSLANQAALQGAQAQFDIQSRVDPQAYAQRQMRMNAANQRLGSLYGVNPNINYRAPDAYSIPGQADLPDPLALARNAQTLAKNLSIGQVSKSGTNPVLSTPTGATSIYPIQPSSPTYLTS